MKHNHQIKKRGTVFPLGISEHDSKILAKVKRQAHFLDKGLFNCCGIRFGWSSVIGIIPGIGDIIDVIMALMVLRTCQQVEGGLPASVIMKMYINIILDFGIGLLPFLGDIADAIFWANIKNAAALEKFLRQKGAASQKAQGQAVPCIDLNEHDWRITKESEPRAGIVIAQGAAENIGNVQMLQPSQARLLGEISGDGRWLSYGGKNKQYDLEAGDFQ